MNRRAGEGLPGPGQGPQRPEVNDDRSPRETARKFLSDAARVEQQAAAQSGVPRAFDYTLALQKLETLREVPADEYVSAAYNLLFEEGAPAGVLEGLGEALVSNRKIPKDQVFRVTESHLKKHFFSGALVSKAHLDFKRHDNGTSRFGGEKWLTELVEKQRVQKHFDSEAAHRIQALARSAANLYGPSAATVTRLMFMCTGNEPSSVDRQELQLESVTKLERIITARNDEARAGVVAEGKNFFERMELFLGVYADITAKVIDSTKDEDQKKLIDRTAKRVLSQLIGAEEFRAAHATPPNPFTVFQDMLLKDKDRDVREKRANPWVTDDCRHTPFDINQFGKIISEDVSRGLIADTALFLSNYRTVLLAQRIERLLQVLERTKRHRVKDVALAERVAHEVTEAFRDMGDVTGRAITAPEDEVQQRRELEKFKDDHIIWSKDSQTGMHPITVLLRAADARKIVTQPNIRQEFIALLSYLPRLDESDGESESERTDRIRKGSIIATSFKDLLSHKEEYMDIPLKGADKDKDPPLRMLLEELVQQLPPETPVAIEPRDLIDMTEEQRARVRRNFDTAKGVDSMTKREWIARAAAVWNDMPKGYEDILGFAERQVKKFYGTQNAYGLTFYPSASAAMNDVVNRLFPQLTEDDYIVISNQEYSGMTEAFTTHGAKVATITCNERNQGIPKDADALFASIEASIREQGKPPRALLLSSKTRFGDAIGIAKGTKTANSYGLSDVIRMFKAVYPAIPVIIDGCQSVGRNDLGEDNLVRLGCDIYVNSGAKALGIENVAMLAIQKEGPESDKPKEKHVPDKQERDVLYVGPTHWLAHLKDANVLKNPIAKLSPGKSTDEVRNIAAFGMALQRLNSPTDTWGIHDAAPEGQIQRERVAERMRKLTEYAIAKTEEYATALLTHPDFPLAPSDVDGTLTDAALRKQFGCEVVYPVHRKKLDYDGIVTLTFPNLGNAHRKQEDGKEVLNREEYLKTELKKEDFLVEQCLAGRNGVRISFHYTHEEKDIDALFEAIARVHIAFLRREVRKHKEKGIDITGFDALRQMTPNVPDAAWMED